MNEDTFKLSDALWELDCLPCPFCGGENPRLKLTNGGYGHAYFGEVFCPQCNARIMPDQGYKSRTVAETAAVRAWNRREWKPEGGAE